MKSLNGKMVVYVIAMVAEYRWTNDVKDEKKLFWKTILKNYFLKEKIVFKTILKIIK